MKTTLKTLVSTASKSSVKKVKSTHRKIGPTQLELLSETKSAKKAKTQGFGGALLKGNPRIKRPLQTKNPMHFVIRSHKASGKWALNHPGRKKQVVRLLKRHLELNGIRLYSYSINSNHIHLLIRVFRREDYRRFVRSFTGLVARLVLSQKRGKASSQTPTKGSSSAPSKLSDNTKEPGFWSLRPFTRIIQWGRAYFEAKFYVMQNDLESIGYLDYRPRNQKVPRISTA